MNILKNLSTRHDHDVKILWNGRLINHTSLNVVENSCSTNQYCNIRGDSPKKYNTKCIMITPTFEHIGCMDTCIPIWIQCYWYWLANHSLRVEKYEGLLDSSDRLNYSWCDLPQNITWNYESQVMVIEVIDNYIMRVIWLHIISISIIFIYYCN